MNPTPDLAPSPARAEDAPGIAALQRVCYRGEAELYGDPALPPLTETVADIRAVLGAHRVLVLRFGAEVVGSIRGELEGDICHVGRLCVRPDLQGRGLGTRLLLALEAACPEARRFELFTGHLSAGNLRLYRRAGYAEFRRRTISPRVQLVYLEKRRHPVAADAIENVGT